MKNLIITLIIMAAITTKADAQYQVYKLNNNADAPLFTWKRGTRAAVPTYDGNGGMFMNSNVKSNPLWADMECLFDSLTTLTTLVQLTEYTLRFNNTTERDAFVSDMNENHFYCYLNDRGDVVIDWNLEEYFAENPNIYETILANQADLIDIFSELQSEGKLNPWPIPTAPQNTQTPTNTLCQN